MIGGDPRQNPLGGHLCERRRIGNRDHMAMIVPGHPI
jgi:hypothetical protein